MEKIKKFTDIVDIKNKRVLLRSDFNVPVFKEEIHDKTRIDVSIPFIQNLLKKEAKVILISHLGRPKSEKDMNLSLKPIFKYLQEKIDHKIHFYSHKITNNTKEKISFLKSGEIIFFENIRFNVGEIKNDENFAKNLSSVAEIYINDAFSCCHRMQASVHKIAKFVKNSYAGPLLMKEISSIDMVLSNKKNPTTCIIGGSKVSTKIGVIVSLIKKVNNLILVGAMANNIFKYKGLKIGKSIYEKNVDNIIHEIFSYAEKNDCKIHFPKDVKVGKRFNDKSVEKSFENIDDDDLILDVGSKTLIEIKKIIDNSSTLLWNGPLGYFENINFSLGSSEIAKYIANRGDKIFSVVGGGDTVAVINSLNVKNKFNFVSTAGGAFLEYLEGKVLPGIKALN